MGRETRLANKTQWGLQDILIRCKTARKRWDKAMKMAERNLDPAMMQLLGRLRDDIGVIELKAKDALNGEYDQEIDHDTEP
jgi:hypothetical protein